MFVQAFHGGPSVEVFTAQGSNPLQGWKVGGKPKKIYDKEVKSFVFDLDGLTKMQVPKDERGTLGLTQGFLALQVKIPPSKGFSVEIAVLDTTQKRRRIVCNSGNKETVATAMHARIPMGPIKRNVWLNLCFDVRDMTSRLWPGTEFQSVELISVGAACKLRRVATMRGAVADSTEDDVRLNCDRTIWQSTPIEDVPKSWHFLPGVPFVNQIFHMHKLYAWEAMAKGETYVPAGYEHTGAMERLGGAASPGPAKFPAAREEPAPSPSGGARLAFGRRVNQGGGAGAPPGTAGSRAQTVNSRQKTPGGAPGTASSRLKTPGSGSAAKGSARGGGGTAGATRRSPSRVDSGLGGARAQKGEGGSRRSPTDNTGRSPMREARQNSRQQQRGKPAASGMDARADARRQEAAARGAVDDVMAVLGNKEVQMAAMEAAVARGHSLDEEIPMRSPLGGGWDGSPRPDDLKEPEPEPEPRSGQPPPPGMQQSPGQNLNEKLKAAQGRDQLEAGGVRQSAQLRKDEIERKRAHLAKLEESYLSRFGGPALGPHSNAMAGAASPGPSSHAGSVAEEVEYDADSMGTGGYDDNYGGRRDDGGGDYDRNRYSGEAEEDSGVMHRHRGSPGPMSASYASGGPMNPSPSGEGGNQLPGGMGTMGMDGTLRGGAVGGGGYQSRHDYPGNGMSPRSPMRASKIGFADEFDGVRIGDSHQSSDPNMNPSGFSPGKGGGGGNFNTPQHQEGGGGEGGGGSGGRGGGGASGGLSPEGYSGLAAFEARLEGLERSFTPPLVPPSNLRTAAAASAAEGGWGHGGGGGGPDAHEGGGGGGEISQGGGAPGVQTGGNGEEIDLLYDPILSCYYDPKTNKYYELRA